MGWLQYPVNTDDLGSEVLPVLPAVPHNFERGFLSAPAMASNRCVTESYAEDEKLNLAKQARHGLSFMSIINKSARPGC